MKRQHILGSLFVLAALAIPFTAMAEDGEFKFKIAGSASSSQAKVNSAIESTLEPYSFVFRKVAQGRLEDTNQVCVGITFTVKGDNLTYSCKYDSGKSLTVTTPTDGNLHTVKGSDGTPYKLKQSIKADGSNVTITQYWKGEDGAKTNTFVYNQDKKHLALKVKVTSGKLDQGPLKYRLKYNQQ